MKHIFGLAAAILFLATSAQAQQIQPAVASTVTSGAIAVTNTFQSVLAQSSLRKGCLVQNTSAAVMYLYLGTTANATLTNSFQLAAGASFNCTVGGITVGDQISLTGTATTSTFVVARQ